jgi:hypothetical protein
MPPAVPPPATASAPPNPDAIRATQTAAQMRQASTLLTYLANSSQNSIPDAVLNGAQCLITARAAALQQVPALISCRADDSWSPPEFLILSLAEQRGKVPASLLWIANGPGSRAIKENTLPRTSFQPGILVRESPTPAETQLTADILAYEYRGGRLWGSEVTITTARRFGVAGNEFVPRNDFHDPHSNVQSAVEDQETQTFMYATSSFFNSITPVGILIHHSGLIPIQVAAQLKEQVIDMIDEFHARRGFEITCFGRVYHVGYHYLILPNGEVEAGRPERCEGAHARGYNSFIGIALVGDFSPATNPTGLYGPSTPTLAQMRALIKLCRRLRQRYHIPIQRVMRHSDATSTSCPGSRFPIQVLLRALEQGGPS